MQSSKLLSARKYEQEVGDKIPSILRPKFHFSPRVGWTNDPNGFSYYNGEYHLFYQYNPYSTVWDSMHWGHAVSNDLLHWKYLPAALAPDENYDSFGCFSGSAATLSDGKQLLIYTGVYKENDEEFQVQCAAVGDGINYEKYQKNPVIDAEKLPAGKSKNNFRDPKIWQESDGSFRCVVAGCSNDRKGAIMLYKSADGFNWEFESVIIENDGSLGLMWECPDFFKLGDNHVLLASPQDMLAQGLEYSNGNGTICLIGSFDEQTKKFTYQHNQSIDYGVDFYAPQTVLAPDGRRIMIGWLQNWDTCSLTDRSNRQWFGQMTLPREITIREGRLIQSPIRELKNYRSGKVEYKNIPVSSALTLDGISGRTIDIELKIRPANVADFYYKFAVKFAQSGETYTSLNFRSHESVLEIDRKFSGIRRACINQRSCKVNTNNNELKLRIILDRFSVEVFVNDGEQAMTFSLLTDIAADGISFCADGAVNMDVTKFDLFAEE